MKKKLGNVTDFRKKLTPGARFLITEEALRGALQQEFALYLGMGKMIAHFAPKMPMLNRVLSPDQPMEPCLESFWTLLDAAAERIETGEWT